jgi:hypothetical protein
VGQSKTVTITAASAVVSISGHLANANGTKHIVEQTSAGKRIILGSFVPAAFVDARGSNFAKAVVLRAGTYTIGTAAGSPGNIFVMSETGAIEPITNISLTVAGNPG